MTMDARDLIDEYGHMNGWTYSTRIDVLCRYIDNQQQEEALLDFLIQVTKDEMMEDDNDVG